MNSASQDVPSATEGAIPERLVADGQRLLAALGPVLDERAMLVARRDTWRQLQPVVDRPASPQEPSLSELAPTLDQSFTADTLQLVPWAGGRQLAIVPVPSGGEHALAVVGLVDGSPGALCQRLATALVKSTAGRGELEQQLERLVHQVTADFEELTWLASLTTCIELCGVEHSVDEVAAQVLPSLRELIGAGGLVLLPMAWEQQPDNVELAPAFVTGTWDVPENVCRELIARFGEAARRGVVVRNASFQAHSFQDRADLRSFMLAAVGKGAHQFGWLLAANKVSCDIDGQTNACSGNMLEFGTNEAGMLTAASVLLGGHARNLAMFREQEELFRGAVKALVDAIEARDSYTCGHSDRVARMARKLAEDLRFSPEDCERIYMSGLLHDIGKIGVPDHVLLKAGNLTDEEFALIKKHPEIGHAILSHLPQLSYVLPGVRHHHEFFDGRGYPDGLAGGDIPIEGRLLAVVDAYDAMTSSRPYREGMHPQRAQQILRAGAGQQWDPQMVEALLRAKADLHRLCGLSPDDHGARIEPRAEPNPAFATCVGTGDHASEDASIAYPEGSMPRSTSATTPAPLHPSASDGTNLPWHVVD